MKIEPNFDQNELEDDSDKEQTVEINRKHFTKEPRRNPPIGYVNPFNYSNLKAKNIPRKCKQPEITNRKWTCIICSEISPDKESLIDHYEIHRINKETKVLETFDHETEYFNCAICGQEFTSLKTYERHFDAKHGERRYTCFVCEKIYKDAFQLAIHNYTAHPEDYDSYQCVSCDFKTAFRGNLKDHLLQHEASCKLKCEICGKGFETESSYEEHKSMHGSTASFSCDVCGETFPYTQHLITHKKEVHPEIFGDKLNQNECHVCNKKFAHKKSLILHIRGHTGEDSVLCDMCGKRLTSGEHLKQHLRIHTGFKPHKCSVCGKGFAKKCNLTLHERVHSGEKPYKCRVCSKSFSQRSTLVIHERYHSGERPYVCTLCNKGFVAKGLLSVHLKTCSAIPEEYL